MIKYTYKGVEHTVNNTVTTLTTAQKYLEDNIVIEAQGSGVTPVGEIRITENGTYDVTNKATAIVDVQTGGGSQYPIIEGEGEHEVRFVDYDGTLIKVQYVNDGSRAIAPDLPEHDRLTFMGWNRDFLNVKHDLDVGALYEPTSGDTELFINLTEETGLTVTLNIYRTVSSGTIRVYWGDGLSSTFATGTGIKTLTHTYSSYGEYMIYMYSTVAYGLGTKKTTDQFIKCNNEVSNYKALIKCFCSEKVTVLKQYCFLNNTNLEEFTMIGTTQVEGNTFSDTKQKTIIIPNSAKQTGNRIATYCNQLEYLILPTNLTNIGGPITTNTKVTKMIYPENYKKTSLTFIAYYDSYEYLWYAKSSTTYAISSSFATNCFQLRRVPIYDNLTGISSVSAFMNTSIEKISLPPSITTIANQTFNNCGNLKDIYIYATTPPTLGGTSVFTGINSLCKIHVPAESLSDYQSATNWSTTTVQNKLVGDLEGEFTDGYC